MRYLKAINFLVWAGFICAVAYFSSVENFFECGFDIGDAPSFADFWEDKAEDENSWVGFRCGFTPTAIKLMYGLAGWLVVYGLGKLIFKPETSHQNDN